MRFLFSIVAALLLTTSLWGASHKMFPADGGSVARENQRAEALGYERYNDLGEVQLAVDSGQLVPVPITVSPRLPVSRRYVRSDAAAFMLELDSRFRSATGHYLIVDSAVRPADVQTRLRRTNRNAAPATGVRASSHERGTTFDLAKKTFNGRDYNRMKRGEYRWLLIQLMYYRETGRILVIEERACIHVFVGASSFHGDSGTNGTSDSSLDYIRPQWNGDARVRQVLPSVEEILLLSESGHPVRLDVPLGDWLVLRKDDN